MNPILCNLKQYAFFSFFIFTFSAAFSQDDSTGSVTDLLNLSLEELMQMKVVTPLGHSESAIDVPATITVITAKQIANRGYEQLEDALRDVPGVDMIHINGYAPTLYYFRGMYGAENLRMLLMIDGIPENNIIGSNDVAGPAYSLHNAERIEIIWGPVSALYGSTAFGGVINIISKKGGDVQGLEVKQGYGSFNTKFEKILVGYRKDNFEFSLAGNLYSSDGPTFKNRDPEYSNSYYDNAFSINSVVTYHAKQSQYAAGFRAYRTPMGWGTFFNSPTEFLHLPPQGYQNKGIVGLLGRDVRDEKGGLNDTYLRTWFVQSEHHISSRLSLYPRIVYRETGTDEDSYAYLTIDGRKLIRVRTASYSNRVVAQLKALWNIKTSQNLTAGAELYRDNVEHGGRKATLDTTTVYLLDGRDTVTNLSSIFLPRKFDIRTNAGVYAQYEISNLFHSHTSITVGSRFDYNSYFGSSFNPRVGIVHQPFKELTLKAQYGTAFRAPTNTEIVQAPPDLSLKTEKIRTGEVNAIYTPRQSMLFQLNFFRNQLRDIIVTGNLAGLNADKNPGEATISGVEAMASVKLSRQANAAFNFTLQDARGKNYITGFSGKIPGVASFKANGGVTHWIKKFFQINIRGNYVGMRRTPRTDPYRKVSGYFLTNVAVSSGSAFSEIVTASFSLQNLFNVKWFDPGFRTADGYLFSTVLEQPGINGLVKLSVKL